MVLVDNGSNSPEETTSTRYAPGHQRRSRLPSRRGRAPGARGPNRNRPLCARRMEISSESSSAHFPGPLICRSRATGFSRKRDFEGAASAAAGRRHRRSRNGGRRHERGDHSCQQAASQRPPVGYRGVQRTLSGCPPPLAVLAPAGCMRRRVRRTWAPTAERQSGSSRVTRPGHMQAGGGDRARARRARRARQARYGQLSSPPRPRGRSGPRRASGRRVTWRSLASLCRACSNADRSPCPPRPPPARFGPLMPWFVCRFPRRASRRHAAPAPVNTRGKRSYVHPGLGCP